MVKHTVLVRQDAVVSCDMCLWEIEWTLSQYPSEIFMVGPFPSALPLRGELNPPPKRITGYQLLPMGHLAGQPYTTYIGLH